MKHTIVKMNVISAMRTIIFGMIASTICITLIGCSGRDSARDNAGDEVSNNAPSKTQSPSTPKESIATDEIPTGIEEELTMDGSFGSIEEIMADSIAKLTPFFILRDGRFYPFEKPLMHIDPLYYDNSWYCATYRAEEELPVIDISAGEQLICISDRWDSYPIYELEFQNYCLPVIWVLGQPRETLAPMDGLISDGAIDEISGEEILKAKDSPVGTQESNLRPAMDSFLQAMSNLGIETLPVGRSDNYEWNEFLIMVGDKGREITVGQYSGTNYNEQTYSFSALLYALNELGEAAVNRTKNGYFQVDVSEYAPGVYAICEINSGGYTKSYTTYSFVTR